MNPLLITSGEPAGIGPDICLSLAGSSIPLVILGDIEVLKARAKQLQRAIQWCLFDPQASTFPTPGDHCLWVWHVPTEVEVVPGQLNPQNSPYVLKLLDLGVQACLANTFSALVTAPVHKGIINDAGIAFSGHTEYLAKACDVEHVVMLLACDAMKVALVTTHLPLSQVPAAITAEQVRRVIQQVHLGMKIHFGLDTPRILVAGLNPHAGEGGHLGREELDVIIPVIQSLQAQGYTLQGPLPADTLFTPANLQQADVVIAMYHDQGLPVLKYAGFGEAVNMTLGLPILRTSVDHGTALDLAGSGQAKAASLQAAVDLATFLAQRKHDEN